jgi:DNA repair exonuclease SbcCD ATPase subunit
VNSDNVMVVEQEKFRRGLWGVDPKDVQNTINELTTELQSARDRAAEAEAAYTELRLSSAKQVEEASAEAAVVLGHSRNEATRIREAAVKDADQMRRDGEVVAQRIVQEAEAETSLRLAEVEEKEAEAQKKVESAQARADEIIRFANSQAEKLRAEAYEILRAAEQRSQAADNDMRLKRLDAERAENDLIDQANQYSSRVHQEADQHWQTTQRRSEELRNQAEDLLRQSQLRANEISKDAVDTARRLMEETMDQLTRIGSEVGGSMSVISRVRRSLGDQLDRLEIAEGRAQSTLTATVDPLDVSLAEDATDSDISDKRTDKGEVGSEATENQDEVQASHP